MRAMFRLRPTLLCLAFAACSSSPPASLTAAAIGVTDVKLSETSTTLDVSGFDAKGERLAEVSLRRGDVVTLDDGIHGQGRQLLVHVGAQQIEHQSIGDSQLSLPFLGEEANVTAFLQDSRVTAPLQRWGIRFVTRDALRTATSNGERPFTACDPWPNAACGATDCCQASGGYQAVCCGNTMQGIYRLCTTPGSMNDCGPTGSSGCAVCGAKSYQYNCFTTAPWGACEDAVDCVDTGGYCGGGAEPQQCCWGECTNEQSCS